MKTGCGGGRCQQGGPAPHGGEHGAAGSPAQQNRPGVRRRAGALLTADLTAADKGGAVIYRRRKQRMPSAIRARKAQHSAAPAQSPAPEAQASMRMSAASRAPTAEAVPQQSRASARDGVRSARSTPGRSAGKPPKPAAAAAAKKRGAVDVAAARVRCPAHSRANTSPPSAGAPGSRPGEHRGSVLWDQPFYQDAQIRPAGQPPRSPAYAPGAEIVRVSVYIHKFLNIKINIRKFNTHIENLCKNNRTKLEKLCKMILE